MLWVLRLSVLFFSLGGLYLFVKNTFRLRSEFVPLVVNSTIGLLILIAGIAKIMLYAWYALFGLGLAFFVYYAFSFFKQPGRRREIFDGKLLLYFVLGCYFAIILRGMVCSHWDNYSIWAMMPKYQLINDQIQRFDNLPGIACFIYFLCKALGNSDACMLFGQSMYLLGALFPLFIYVTKKKWFLLPILLGGCVYLLVGNVPITELLLDTALPVPAIGCMAIIYFYRRQLARACLAAFPVCIFIVFIKSIGIFFTLILCLFLFCLYWAQRAKGKDWLLFIGLYVGLPVALLAGGIIYAGTSLNAPPKLASIPIKLLEMLRGGDPSSHRLFDHFQRYLSDTITLQSPGIQMLILVILVLLIGLLLNRPSRQHPLRSVEVKIAGFAILTYSLYQVMTYVAFYFIGYIRGSTYMLPSYWRYNQSVVLLIYGFLLLYVLNRIDALSGRTVFRYIGVAVMTASIFLPIIPHADRLSTLVGAHDISGSFRYQLEKAIAEKTIPPEKHYFIYMTEMPVIQEYPTGSYVIPEAYMWLVMQYCDLDPQYLCVVTRDTLPALGERIAWTDYCLILSHDSDIDSFLAAQGYPTDQTAFSIREAATPDPS